MENMHNLERIRLVTKYYDQQLQGLRQVPFGLLFLLIAVRKMGWWPWFDTWQPLSGLLILGLALIAFWGAGLYYQRTFGQVWQSASNRRNSIILALLFFGGIYLAGWAEYEWRWPVSGTGLVTAVFLVAYYLYTGRLRPHYLALAALMVIVGLLPLFGVVSVEVVYLWGMQGGLGAAAFGIIWLVSGIGDHWFLIRGFQPMNGELNNAS